ncbi:MAG: hypothetical protein AB4426_28210 [Xenococcaceae cyanobacterium]
MPNKVHRASRNLAAEITEERVLQRVSREKLSRVQVAIALLNLDTFLSAVK